MNSPLLLNKVEVTRLAVDVISITQEQDCAPQDKIDLEWNCDARKGGQDVRVRLKIGINRSPTKNTCQHIETELFTYFSFAPETDDELKSRFVPNVCVAHAVGYARHVIAQATHLMPGGSYWLPLMNVTKPDVPLIGGNTDNSVLDKGNNISDSSLEEPCN
jgi:hypothetical protein